MTWKPIDNNRPGDRGTIYQRFRKGMAYQGSAGEGLQTGGTTGSVANSTQTRASALGFKPLLTPKPFSLQRNTTFRSIHAPRTAATASPASKSTLHQISEPTGVPKATSDTPAQHPPHQNITSDSKPSSVNVHTKDQLKPTKGDNISLDEKHGPDPSIAVAKSTPASQPAAPKSNRPDQLKSTDAVQPEPIQKQVVTQRSRKASTDSLSPSEQREEGEKGNETETSVTSPLFPNSQDSGTKTSSTSSPPSSATPQPQWGGTRKRLSMELTLKFESGGLSLPSQPTATSTTRTKDDGNRPVSSDPEQRLTTLGPPNRETDEGEPNEERSGGSNIKSRISLLLDSSSRPEVTMKREEPQTISQSNGAGGVKERIRSWAVETNSEMLRTETKPQPLPRGHTKSLESVEPDAATTDLSAVEKTQKNPPVELPVSEAPSAQAVTPPLKISPAVQPRPLETSTTAEKPSESSTEMSGDRMQNKSHDQPHNLSPHNAQAATDNVPAAGGCSAVGESVQRAPKRDNPLRRSVHFGVVERDDGRPPEVLGSESDSSPEEEGVSGDEAEDQAPVLVPVYQRARNLQRQDDEIKRQEEQKQKCSEFKERQRAEENGEERMRLQVEEERKRTEEEERERQRETEERLREEEKLRERERQREERLKEEEKERERLKEEERERERLREEERETEKQMQLILQRQREEEREKVRQKEERLREEERERERLREEKERERLREEERGKERLIEEERLREEERERERLREEERERERLREEKERERLREEERERERLREEERERERLREEEREKERLIEEERLREEEREGERLREEERERERLREEERERERLREEERERERLREEERERERLREEERERERLREEERERERLREEERERERLREEERERERLREEERERERLREEERERERLREEERERERLKEEERERERLREEERERERLREEERERERLRVEERERERLREEEREKERLREERERERLREEEREKERLREEERDRQIEEERVNEQERERQEELERKKAEETEAKLRHDERRREEEERERERLKDEGRIKQQEEERERQGQEEVEEKLRTEEEKEEKEELELSNIPEEAEPEVMALKIESPSPPPSAQSSEPTHNQLQLAYDDFSVKKPLIEMIYDDFSVKPRRWGSPQAKADTSPVQTVELLLPLDVNPQEPEVSQRDQVEKPDSPEPSAAQEGPEEGEQTSEEVGEEDIDMGEEVEKKKEDEGDEDVKQEEQVKSHCTKGEGLDTAALIDSEPDQQYGTCEQTSPETDSPKLIPDHGPEVSCDDLDATPLHIETELPAFPESSTPLLDTHAQRSRAELGKRRSQPKRPPRTVRQTSAPPTQTESATPNWRVCDSTDGKVVCSKKKGSDSEEDQPRSKEFCSPPPTSQRVPMFPGLSSSALMAQLKKRAGGGGGEEAEVEKHSPSEEVAPSPSQLSRSPALLAGAARVLPPLGGTDGGTASSPSWLKELKSKRRMSQHDSEA